MQLIKYIKKTKINHILYEELYHFYLIMQQYHNRYAV